MRYINLRLTLTLTLNATVACRFANKTLHCSYFLIYEFECAQCVRGSSVRSSGVLVFGCHHKLP